MGPTPKRKRSMADQLADLLTPKPSAEFDPEAYDDFDNGAALVESEEELNDAVSDEEAETAAKNRAKARARRAPEKGLSMKGDIAIDDQPEYTGKTTSWKKFKQEAFGPASSDEEQDDAGDDSEDDALRSEFILQGGDDDSDAEYSMDDGSLEEEEEQEEERDVDGAGVAQGRRRRGPAAASSGEDEDGGDGGSFDFSAGSEDDEAAELEREYAAMRAEEQAAVEALKAKQSEERKKGAAVKHQRMLWDRMVEIRILMQGSVSASNQLPLPPTHRALTKSDKEVKAAFKGLAAAARNTLMAGLQVFGALLGNNAAIGTAAEEAGVGEHYQCAAAVRDKAGTLLGEGLWEALDRGHVASMPFCRAACDTWQRKASAAGVLQQGKLQALNQSVSLQVDAMLRNPTRAVQRTQLPVHAVPRRPCEPASPAAITAADDTNGETSAALACEEARDAETFDDAEFYTQLLKEFVDQGAAGVPESDRKSEKRRKLVDRRASKGRKIRYEVHEKLANFMAPVDKPLPPMAQQLISAQLFGAAAVAM